MMIRRAPSEEVKASKRAATSIPRLLMHHGRHAGQSAVRVCLLGAMLICLSGSACVRQEAGCPEEYAALHPEECDYLLTTQIDSPRFDFPSPTVKPSQDFWMKAGEDLVVRWNEYSIFYDGVDAACDFSTDPPPSTLDCDVCRFCNPGMGCYHPTYFQDGSTPQLIGFAGFMLQSEPSVQSLFVRDGCLPGFSFRPERNTTYQLLKYARNRTPIAETKAFVIEAGGVGQRITYQLSYLPQITQDAVFYSGAVTGNPILEDNFSPSLQITRVRFLKGTASRDPVTGKLQILNPSPVHPSRIVLISNYDGGEVFQGGRDSTRCYADESEYGDLDLTRCRVARGVSCTANNPGCKQPATPTSLAGSTDLLTWVAEFKPAEGGIAPTLEPGEVLAVEFTIEAAN